MEELAICQGGAASLIKYVVLEKDHISFIIPPEELDLP